MGFEQRKTGRRGRRGGKRKEETSDVVKKILAEYKERQRNEKEEMEKHKEQEELEHLRGTSQDGCEIHEDNEEGVLEEPEESAEPEEPETKIRTPSPPLTPFTTSIRLLKPANSETFGLFYAHLNHMKDHFSKLLKSICAEEVTWKECGRLQTATYEPKDYYFDGQVTFKKGRGDELDQFLDRVVEVTDGIRYMLHDQIHLEFPELEKMFQEKRIRDSDITITGIAMGNRVNAGTFFIRGDYWMEKTAEKTEKTGEIEEEIEENDSDDSSDSTFDIYAPKEKYEQKERQKRLKREEKRAEKLKEKYKTPLISDISFEHDRKLITIVFGVRLLNPDRGRPNYTGYKVVIGYGDIKTIIADFSKHGTDSEDGDGDGDGLDHIYMELSAVPQLWEAVNQDSERVNMQEHSEWIRTLNWAGDAQQKGVGCSVEAFSQSPCIRLTFDRSEKSQFLPLKDLVRIVTRIQSRSNAKLLFGPIYSSRRKLAPMPILKSLGSYRANYNFQALMTRGSVFMDQVFDAKDCRKPGEVLEVNDEPAFLKIVRKSMKDASWIAEESLENLVRVIDEGRKVDVLETYLACFEEGLKEYQNAVRTGESYQFSAIPQNCLVVRKAVITPSRVLLMPPDIMMENRVLRRFGSDHALRVVFRDENLKKLLIRDYSPRGAEGIRNLCSEGIEHALKHGLRIADRHYEFLGWSNSQMRDQGCYFYAPKIDSNAKKSGTISEIRHFMGNFDNVKTVSKLMSRMGQCFTQAQPTVMLASKHYIVERDIEGGLGNQYCFSDGCGRISFKLAQKIAKILQLEYIPSVFQIRFKGFKGILVIDPTIDLIVNMPKIIFRKSQEKFDVHHSDSDGLEPLEVVKYSMPSEMCLNRPFLTVLDHVSARQSVESHRRIVKRVHYYLEREFAALSNMLLTEKHAAEELTNRCPLPINWSLIRQSGMELTTDPFIKTMLFTIYKYNIISHISKAKLMLPTSMGRSMYGVVDETGLLQYGQVFIQYSKSMQHNPNEKPILHVGKVMITKNPCLVPGDVRVFQAVWQPALSHLVDVVVFPQHGPRPHPDEMAGSDLDGDEYSVILDPELFLDHNEEAMTYPSSKEPETSASDKPTLEAMVDVFLNYMSQDAIGTVSTAHLISADVNGLFSKQCESIAHKCAIAVDFPKSGIPAPPLSRDELTAANPDYIPSRAKPSYYSTRLNGQIYRKGQRVEEILDHTRGQDLNEEEDAGLGHDKLLCPDGYFLDDYDKFQVYTTLEEYSRRLQYLMDEYGIDSEASLISGHPTTIRRLAAMEKDDYSFYHTDKIVQLRYAEVTKEFRKRFFEEFGGEEANKDVEGNLVISDTMDDKIRKWYWAAYVNPPGKAVGKSLPWVVWEVLADARRKLLMDSNTFTFSMHHPIAVKLSNALQGSIDANWERFEEFLVEVEEEPNALFLRKYSKIYGPNLPKIIFLLNQWLQKENIFPSDDLNIWNVGRLLIRFALGAATEYIKNETERKTLEPTIKFHKWCSKKVDEEVQEEKLKLDMADTGTLVLEFLRFLSSQTFSLAENQKLRVFDDRGIIEPFLWREEQWMPLHNVAYRTFHLIAATGRFTALRLDDEVLAEHISESIAPILISSQLDGRKYGDSGYISRQQILEAIKNWSGCKDIQIRCKVQNLPWMAPVEYVTCVGSALARQRLQKIMYLDEDQILEAVHGKYVPSELLNMVL